ncbi:hypothetical protein ACHAQD_012394 [Fusarium lateritium]
MRLHFGACFGAVSIILGFDDYASTADHGIAKAPSPETSFDSRLLPSYEPHLVMEPTTMHKHSNWARTLDLENLVPTLMSEVNGQLVKTCIKVTRIPEGVPKLVQWPCSKSATNPLHLKVPAKGTRSGKHPNSHSITYWPSREFHDEFGFGATTFPAQVTVLQIELRGSLMYETVGWSVFAGLETPGAKGAYFLDYFAVKLESKNTLTSASSPTKVTSHAAALV